jgi:putative hydrolase of the HAD superfamily
MIGRGVLLDLDDTLYPERDYFESGLAAVAAFLGRGHAAATAQALADLEASVATYGRNGVLDRVAPPAHLPTSEPQAWTRTLLHVYRTHTPRLRLFEDAHTLLDTVRDHGGRLALVTDGKSCVQWRKLRALGLEGRLDALVVTDDLDTPKPSPEPFRVAAALLGLPPEACVYLADDPSKDFLGPHALGMGTIHVQRRVPWPLARPAASAEAEAQVRVDSLTEATHWLVRDAR